MGYWEIALLIALLIFTSSGLLVYYNNYRAAEKSLAIQVKRNESLGKEIEKQKVRLVELKSKAVIEAGEIEVIKSDGHYIELYLKYKDKPEVDRNTLKHILEVLPDYFIQIHKSYIINLKEIRVKYGEKIEMKNGQTLPISRTYKQAFNQTLEKIKYSI